MCKKGGGVLVAVKCLLPSFAIDIISHLETQLVDVKISDMDVFIGTCYRAPDYGRHFVSSLAACMNQVFSSRSNCLVILELIG